MHTRVAQARLRSLDEGEVALQRRRQQLIKVRRAKSCGSVPAFGGGKTVGEVACAVSSK